MTVNESAVEAAMSAWLECSAKPGSWSLETEVRAALEAAAPHMLSHEREETRLAHVDAVVNAETVDRLERELDEERKKVELLVSSQSRPAALVALAEAWQRGYERSEQDYPDCATVCGGCKQCMSEPTPNPYL